MTNKNIVMLSYKHRPPLGAHTSIAGGISKAIYTAKKIGCDVIQLFSKNQMQWKAKPLAVEEIHRFHRAIEETGILPMMVHDSYLINLASSELRILQSSLVAFTEELQRCEALGIPYLVMHPGAHLDQGEEVGLTHIAENILHAYEASGVSKTIVLLETTAGQGTHLGYCFEHLRFILEKTGLGDAIGVCLDTCHVFAAGYDIRKQTGWQRTKEEFNRIIGFHKLKALHLNDSKKGLGSRVDRHQRIGQGEIGIEGFRSLLHDPDLQTTPMILEIPGGEAAYQEDLLLLRSLLDDHDPRQDPTSMH